MMSSIALSTFAIVWMDGWPDVCLGNAKEVETRCPDSAMQNSSPQEGTKLQHARTLTKSPDVVQEIQ